QAADAATARAREAIELARVESARANAEQQALAALKEKTQAGEAARIEAERRAESDRDAAQVAQQRRQADAEARSAAQARAAADRCASEAARKQAHEHALVAKNAKALEARLKHEQEEARTAARELMTRMREQRKDLRDWRERAAAVLADAPDSSPKPVGGFKRAMLLRSAAAIAGITVAALLLNSQGTGVVPAHASVQPAPMKSLEARPAPAVMSAVDANSQARPVHMQMSYRMTAASAVDQDETN
ncbi:hypothetical protein AAFM71_22725, partial [Chromobacterium violaceum]